ncbi:MAG: GPP34 family phosphoprotein [Anaerolineaceae bacterium]
MLTLPEELWLLALNEKNGKLKQINLVQGLTSAILVELALEKRIDSKGNRKVEVIDKEPLNNAVLDFALGKINAAPDAREVRRWMLDLGSLQQKMVYDYVAEALVEHGHIERVEESKLGGLIKKNKWILKDKEIRNGILERIRGVAFENKAPTLRTFCLMLLSGENDIIRISTTRDERAKYQTRVKQLLEMLEEPRSAHARNIIVLVLKAIENNRESWSG